MHVHHKAQFNSSFSIALGLVQALDADGGKLTMISHISLTFAGALLIGPSLSFHADIDWTFDNQCGSGLFHQITFEVPSFHVLFCDVPNLETSALGLRSMTRFSYLVLSEAHTQGAGKSARQVWPNKPCDPRVILG